jgi:hypothetical protein
MRPVIDLAGRILSVRWVGHHKPSTCAVEEDSALLMCLSFSPASTVMRHALCDGFGVLDGTRAGDENLKKLLN